MMTKRLVLLAVMALCVSLAHAANEYLFDQDIENNEVLPESDVRRARVNEVPANTAYTTTNAPPSDTTDQPSSSSTTTTTTTERSTPPSSTTPRDVPPPPTSAPPRPQSTLSRFLSDIIQIPINVLRSVGTLLSSTFSAPSGSAATVVDAPDDFA